MIVIKFYMVLGIYEVVYSQLKFIYETKVSSIYKVTGKTEACCVISSQHWEGWPAWTS